MTDRRRQGREVPGRVHGAWTTPAVVVRRPDGSIVGSGPGPTDGEPGPDDLTGAEGERGPVDESGAEGESGADGVAADRAGAGADGDGERPRPRRARPRPRRIPGAAGSVLLVPTLTDAGSDVAGRRLRRNSGTPATVTPLPPRVRPVAAADGGDAADPPDTAAGAGTATPAPASTRPSLRVVGEALRRGAQPSADRRRASVATTTATASGPGPRRRRKRRSPGVVRRLRALDLDRLLPADPEERAKRIARWRRAGARVAALVVAVVLIYTVFPVRTALELRAAEDRARERQAAFQREIDILEDEARDLRTDDRVEEEARELGLVKPGEESYGIYPAPEGTAPARSTTTTAPPGG